MSVPVVLCEIKAADRAIALDAEAAVRDHDLVGTSHPFQATSIGYRFHHPGFGGISTAGQWVGLVRAGASCDAIVGRDRRGYAELFVGIRVSDAGTRKMETRKALHALPCSATAASLAALADLG